MTVTTYSPIAFSLLIARRCKSLAKLRLALCWTNIVLVCVTYGAMKLSGLRIRLDARKNVLRLELLQCNTLNHVCA